MLSILRRLVLRRLILASVGLVAAIAFWYFAIRTLPIPQRTLRIGFEQVPPVQIRTGNGFSGLAVETVREAAKRAGLSLQWVETGTSSEEALRRGLVDLWPIMADLPERRKHVHITKPWLHTSHTLVLPADREPPGREFTGRIALIKLPIHSRLVRQEFPNAQLVQLGQAGEVVKEVCRGTVFAGFLEGRAGLAALREKPAECAGTGLRVHTLPHLTLPLGVGSTFEAAGAADRIRKEIGGLFRDGTLAVTIAKYSYYGIDATWATYALMQAEEHASFIAWGISGLGIALAITVWQAASLRQRKRSEATLRASEERFRRVFEEGPLGLALVGRDYRFAKVNGALCRMVGYEEAELVQKTFAEITHPDDVRADVELAEHLFKRDIPFYRIQKRYVKRSGEIIWINLTASVLRSPDGEPVHGLAMVEDITEAKRTQEEALARQKLESIGVLAAGIAHDFNNLLGGILLQAESIVQNLPEGSPQIEELHRIREAAIRGSEIVRELMIYSGQDKADLEPVDVGRLLGGMLGLLKLSVSKHVVLKTDLPKDLPAVRGNGPRMRQLVMNLVINASEAIGETDGEIRVTLSREAPGQGLASNDAANLRQSGYLRLEVSDNGSGMTEETQARVFDPFFTTKFAGRGLGLAVVQSIVSSHGGEINVVSAPGRGTTFQIDLPCMGEPANSDESAAVITSGDDRISGTTGTVLLVEDEDMLRDAVSKMLRMHGFSVIEAGNGSAALDLVRSYRNSIEVILLDLTIPGAPSSEVVGEVHRIRPGVTVVLMSAYSQDMVPPSLNVPEVKGFIRKPFQTNALVQLLRDTISAERYTPAATLIAGTGLLLNEEADSA